MDFSGIESSEFAACTDLYRAVPAQVQALHDVQVREIGNAICMSCRGIDPPAMFRRAVGLGTREPATEAGLDAVIGHMDGIGERYAIPVAPLSQPPTLGTWLEQRGFSRGYAWMRFIAPCGAAPSVDTNLDVRVIGGEHAGEFGRVIGEAFGLPPTVAPWLAALVGRDPWICVMAFDGASAVAAGGVFVSGEYAWLGFGATLASHRRRGAQNALLALRMRAAAARGARIACTETGERLPDKPSHSYRNILRAGFTEAYVRQNYLSPLRVTTAG
jgi:hypothetical protein